VRRQIARNAPEGGGDGEIARSGKGEVDRIRPDLLALAMVTDAIAENASALSVAVSMVLSTEGVALQSAM